MDLLNLIHTHYPKGSPLTEILLDHSRRVADRALAIARHLLKSRPHLPVDLTFLEGAALTHDIGIYKTRARAIGCTGEMPYICHGYLGRELLDRAGLDPAYGLVAERHTGAGITLDNIRTNQLPLPHRDMVPVTLEEKIICCADKFYSKDPAKQDKVPTLETITAELHAIDPDHAARFRAMARELHLKA